MTGGHGSPAEFERWWRTCWAWIRALLVLYVLLALTFPARSLHDRLAGTALMPK
jgi:hypothetical protein